MASYGYANRGYTAYNDMDPPANDHINPRYGGGYSQSDHVCKPVIIDAEGRKQPIISYTPSESYVVKKETIVEHVPSPMTEYKNYGVPNNDKWRRPSSPIYDRDRPHVIVEHYRYGSPTKYEVNNDKWHRPSSPIYDRPQKVEDFITNVQTEVSQPRIGPLTGSYRRNPANPSGHTESTGYGDWNKPTANAIRNERLTEPAMVNTGGWSRPAPLGWTKSASRPLTGPTNDIGEAVNFIKEAVKITTGAPSHTRYSNDGYTETIDSTEAKRRYARPLFKTSSESYNGTINGKDAVDKYGGAFVP